MATYTEAREQFVVNRMAHLLRNTPLQATFRVVVHGYAPTLTFMGISADGNSTSRLMLSELALGLASMYADAIKEPLLLVPPGEMCAVGTQILLPSASNKPSFCPGYPRNTVAFLAAYCVALYLFSRDRLVVIDLLLSELFPELVAPILSISIEIDERSTIGQVYEHIDAVLTCGKGVRCHTLISHAVLAFQQNGQRDHDLAIGALQISAVNEMYLADWDIKVTLEATNHKPSASVECMFEKAVADLLQFSFECVLRAPEMLVAQVGVEYDKGAPDSLIGCPS
jgi:hypothetical protein